MWMLSTKEMWPHFAIFSIEMLGFYVLILLFQPKCIRFCLVAVLCPDPLESLSDPPEHLAVVAEKMRIKEWREKGRKKRREGREGKDEKGKLSRQSSF